MTKIKQNAKDLWNYFSTYEKVWYAVTVVLAVVFAFLFPEEDVNGVNGKLIMALYVADVVLNVTCELLISKQSKWNFVVSLGVEVVEIAIPLILAFRFATIATTLLFWIPVDVISFVNWHRHPDKVDAELTEVRKLTGKKLALVLLLIAVWTVGVGTLLCYLDIGTELFDNKTVETVVCYVDACASAVGVANGVFILLRYREQWFAWYAVAVLETVINVLSGQWVLLVLKAAYLTNTTYGYIKWTRYINKNNSEKTD